MVSEAIKDEILKLALIDSTVQSISTSSWKVSASFHQMCSHCIIKAWVWSLAFCTIFLMGTLMARSDPLMEVTKRPIRREIRDGFVQKNRLTDKLSVV